MNPLTDIEDAHVAQGLGALAGNIYKGAREQGLSRLDSLYATSAALVAIMESGLTHGQENTDE